MERTFTAAERVIAAAGDVWVWALVLSFFAIALESAKPKAAEGEAKSNEGLSFLFVLLALANLITPFLLFWHGFQIARVETSRPLYIVGLLVGGSTVLGALVGWTIGAAVPAFGRVITRAAPVLSGIVFLLALYVAFPDTVAAPINQVFGLG